MAELPTSVYLGTPEPKVSPFGRSSAFFVAKPTTGEVAKAFIEETFVGEGSLSQDIQASNIRKQERREDPISIDDWKSSDSFRDGIKHYDTMTNASAATLAKIHDDRADRNLIISKASKMQTVLGFSAGFLSGVVEPKNLASGVVAALATGGAGTLIPSMGRMIATNTVKGAAARGAIEGVAAAALTEPSNLESSKIVQGDYTMADSLINLTLGSILGAGLGAGVKKLELRGKAKVAAKEKELTEAYRAETDAQALKEMDTALSQTVQGVAIDVGAVKQVDIAQAKAKAVKQLPKIEARIAALGDALLPIPQDKVILRSGSFDTQGRFEVPSSDIYAHKIKAIESKDRNAAESLLESGEFADSPQLSVPVEDIIPTQKLLDSESLNKAFDAEVETGAFLVKKGDKFFVLDGHNNVASNIIKGEGSVNAHIFDADVGAMAGKEFSEAGKLRTQRARLLKDANQTVDQAPIKGLQDQIAKPDNSTAYNPKSADAIKKELEEFKDLDDQIALERELEDLQEQVAELFEQGLLNKDEIATIERLAEIDAESAIFDNVLLDVKLCLTRG